MLNVEEIRLLVLQGRIPAYWHIVRGSIRFVVRTMAIRFFFFAILPPMLALMTSATIDAFLGKSSSLQPSLFPLISQSAIVALVFVVFLTLKLTAARDTVIVFLPEGCLEFQFISNRPSLPYTWKAIWYARTTDIQLHSTIFGMYLTIHTCDGINYKWSPQPCFGKHNRIMQDILMAYATYQTLVLNLPNNQYSAG